MSKKIIIVIILLILLAAAGACYYFVFLPEGNRQILLSSNENVESPGADANLPINQLEPSAQEAGEAQAHEVQITNFSFSPQNLDIKIGDTVKWTNDDQPPHQINGADFISPILNTGDSFSHTFNTAGSFAYRCAFYPAMTGKITVNP